MDLLRRNPGEKKLVFVHYRETLTSILADLLAREGFAFTRFEGAFSGSGCQCCFALRPGAKAATSSSAIR